MITSLADEKTGLCAFGLCLFPFLLVSGTGTSCDCGTSWSFLFTSCCFFLLFVVYIIVVVVIVVVAVFFFFSFFWGGWGVRGG